MSKKRQAYNSKDKNERVFSTRENKLERIYK